MADEELSFILSIEDRMSSEAAEAQDSLESFVAGPYEGEVSLTAKLEDEASEGLETVAAAADNVAATGELLEGAWSGANEAVTGAGAAAAETEGQLTEMAAGAADLAQEVEGAGEAARRAAAGMDDLAQSQQMVSDTFAENADAAGESNDALGDAASAATVAGVGAQGAAVSGRALGGVFRTLGKEAGLSKGALTDFNTASRTGTMVSRLFANGAGAAAKTLARFGAYGAAAAAAIAGVGMVWKYNLGSIRDVTMSVRLSVASSMKSMAKSFSDAGKAVHNFGQEHKIAGAPVRALEWSVRKLGQGVSWLGQELGKEGRFHNEVTAAIERNKAAQDRLRTAIDASKTAMSTYTSAARGYEDAHLRITDASHGAERAQISLERAKQRSGAAQANLTRLYQAGITSGEEYTAAVLEVQDADLGLREAQMDVSRSTQEKVRSSQDAETATDDLMGATKELNEAYQEEKAANDEMITSTNDLAARYAELSSAAQVMRTQTSAAWQEMAADVEAQAARIKAAQDQIDPTLRRSPSLVDRVVTGVDEITNQYKKLGNFAAANPVPLAQNAGQKAAPIAAAPTRVDIDVSLNEGKLEGLIEVTVNKVLGELGVSADRDNRTKFKTRFA